MLSHFVISIKVKYWIALAFLLKLGLIYIYIAGRKTNVKKPYGNSSNIPIESRDSNLFPVTLIEQPNCKIITMLPNQTNIKPRNKQDNHYVGSYVDLIPLDDGSYILYKKLQKEDQNCVRCCYNELKVDVHFNGVDIKKYKKYCTPFHKVVKMRRSGSNMVQTTCESMCDPNQFPESTRSVIQIHPILQIKKNVKAITKVNFWKQLQLTQLGDNHKYKFKITSKIILISIDGISRTNEQLLIPKTLKILSSSGFNNFKGYTSLSQDPQLNFISSITGLNGDNWDESCGYSENNNYFECPFIWKDFSKANYVTAFMDYKNQINFPKKPTDYYFNLNYYKLMNLTKTNGKSTIHMSDLLFKSTALFNRIFEQSPSISITRLPLPTLSESQDFDNLLSSFVTEISSSSTGMVNLPKLVIIYSNVRAVSSTRKKSYKQPQPILYVKLHTPDEQKKVNPNLNYFQSSMERNKLMLTSPLNIYDTLKQILELALASMKSENVDENESKRSLLKPISKFHNCNTAGIPIGICPCNLIPSLENIIPFLSSAHINKLQTELLQSMNNLIPNYDVCSKYIFKKFIKFTLLTNVNVKPQFNDISQEFNVIFQLIGVDKGGSKKIQQRVKTILSPKVKKVYFQLLGKPVIISTSSQKGKNENCLQFSIYPNIHYHQREFCICKK